MTAPQTPPVCARCAAPLPGEWYWARDAEAEKRERLTKLTGQAVCYACATPKERDQTG